MRLQRQSSKAGFSLLEVTITTTLFVVIFMASITLIENDRRLSRSILQISHVELMSQDMLFGLKAELANAFGENPEAIAPIGFGAGEATLQVDSTLGFPPRGSLVIDRGNGKVERVAYAGFEGSQTQFLNVQRGLQCTTDVTHDVQAEVIWAGLAEPLEQQDPPPDVEDYDGISMESSGPVYYRGDGIGFSFRVPVDPAGGTDYLEGSELKWGANIPGVGPTLDGWLAVYYRANTVFYEAGHGDDINNDGDTNDVFDVGQIRKIIWDVTDPTVPVRDIGLGPSNVLQEQCNYGSDLDADDFNDPMFLWDKDSNELHVRLFIIGTSVADMPVIRKVEEVMFLRNEPEL